MDLSIIIVNYHSRDKLLNCLSSLRQAEMVDVKYEIIVVDNNSGDELDKVNEDYSTVQMIKNPVNKGMGGGNNIGLAIAQGEYVLILNPDTVVQGRAIPELLSYLKSHPTVGLIGPKLLYPDGALQMSCSRFPSFFMPILRRTFIGDYFKTSRDSFTMQEFNHNSLRSVDWLMGSCLMFKKEIKLSDNRSWSPHFDERYFMYFEDTDLARQFWKNGLSVVYNPTAIVIHDHRRASARHPWYLAIFLDIITWHHIISWLKYFIKWSFKTKNYVKN